MMIKRKVFAKRAVALILLVLTFAMLTLSLTSCTSSYSSITDLEKENVHHYVARIIANDETLRVRFIAASRGHDITSPEYDETEIKPETVYSPDVDAAKAIMQEILDNGNFNKKNSEDREYFADYMNNLGITEVKLVAEQLKTTVELKTDNGFFAILLVWIGKALGWVTGIFGGSYIVAILVFAVIIEILMLPMSIKQQKNSIGMAKLRPKIAKIEKKYAGRYDQATMRKKQEEIMALQQKEGYSPFSGCLPLLVQLIVVGFILYPIIQNPLRYMLDSSDSFSSALLSYATSSKAVGGLGLTLSSKGNVIELLTLFDETNIKGLADFALIKNGAECLANYNALVIPNFTLFGINLGIVPSITDFSILLIIPVINVAAQVASMSLTKKWNATGVVDATGTDPQSNASMKMMNIVAPLMTLFILFQVPALIGVYWFFRSVISLVKQYILKTVMPLPRYTDEELKEMEKAEKERQKAQKAAVKEQPKYRSLHYIDEDDYEELPELNSDNKQSDKKKFTNTDMPEIKD